MSNKNSFIRKSFETAVTYIISPVCMQCWHFPFIKIAFPLSCVDWLPLFHNRRGNSSRSPTLSTFQFCHKTFLKANESCLVLQEWRIWKEFPWIFHLPQMLRRYFSSSQDECTVRLSHQHYPDHGECPFFISLSREKGITNSGSLFCNLPGTFASFHLFRITVHIARGQHCASNHFCRNAVGSQSKVFWHRLFKILLNFFVIYLPIMSSASLLAT